MSGFRIFVARGCFMVARYFLSKGMLWGQWFQNRGILLLTGVKPYKPKNTKETHDHD